jgi:hypothetical protein
VPVQPAGEATQAAGGEAASGQGVLERREQGHRAAIAQERVGGQEEEAAGGCLVEGHAGAVVDGDIEAGKLGRDPARELAVGGNQRGDAAWGFERLPELQGDQ